ncbi:MAG TPA: hypothetical protein VNI20_05510 [Fimbriimonadaceae bacterium]|nr:hypothetical protein [Fimbriimonadaceae bacterium]
MKQIFEGQPLSSEAPQGLRNRVEFASRQVPRRAPLSPRFKWAIGGSMAAAAAAVIGAAMFLAPAKAEAKTWDMVTAAYQQVHSVLVQMQFSGDESGSLTIAGKGKDWRISMNGMGDEDKQKMDVSYHGGELTIWDGGDTAQVIDLGFEIPFSPEDVMHNLTKELSASKIFKEHANEIGKNNIQIEQPHIVDGRNVYNVTITDPHGNGQFHVLVDADTDLPINMEVRGQEGVSMKMSFQFDGDFDDSLLQPILPSGIKFEHIDKNMIDGPDKNDMVDGLKELGKAFHGENSDKDGEVHTDVRVKVRT